MSADTSSKETTNAEKLAQVCNAVRKENPAMSARELPYHVFLKLQELLSQEENFLDVSDYAPAPTGYARYVLYTHKDAEQPFCMTLIVLRPGQSTPRHSHRCDCGPVCIEGTITEVRYEDGPPHDDNGNPTLRMTRRYTYQQGQGGYLRKEEPNIHHLENASTELAMSLHLYLFDPDECCPEQNTSVDKVFF